MTYADVLAWCLMPNHFHLMIAVREQDQSERVSIESGKLKYQNYNSINAGITQNLDEEQMQTCFRYIHNNSVEASLAKRITDWEFSSALDIVGIRKGTLINKTIIEELGLHL